MKKLSLALFIGAALFSVGCKKKKTPTSVDYQGTTLYFTSGKIGEPSKWSNNFSSTGATSLTDGKANTDAIVAALTAAGDSTDYPAKKCADLVQDGHDDWYLPSLNEFKAIATLGDDLPGDFTGMYWTSTERAVGTAEYWYIHFASQYNNNKGYKYNCLCTRKD